MKWEDIVAMPRAELDEYIDQGEQWAAMHAGAELKD